LGNSHDPAGLGLGHAPSHAPGGYATVLLCHEPVSVRLSVTAKRQNRKHFRVGRKSKAIDS